MIVVGQELLLEASFFAIKQNLHIEEEEEKETALHLLHRHYKGERAL